MKLFCLINLILATALGAMAGDRVQIIPTSPPTDQADTLQCWAVTATARLDAAAALAGHGLIKLSPKYIVYAKTRAEVVALIRKGTSRRYRGTLCERCKPEPIYYEQGGIYPDAVEAAKLYGVMPESAYPGFPREDERLFRKLNKVIDHYAKHRATKRSAPDVVTVSRIVESVLDEFLGRPPERFRFEGREYDPLEFFHAILPAWRGAKAREMNFDPSREEGPTRARVFDGRMYPAYRTRSRGRLLSVLAESLRAGEPVVLRYLVVDEDRTQRDGKIGFGVHGLVPERPKGGALEHYVLAVGARWPEGDGDRARFSELLVKNTWGISPRENNGYHWIQPDYFPLITGVEVSDALFERLIERGLIPAN